MIGRIQVIGALDGFADKRLSELWPKIEKLAETNDTTVKVAQRKMPDKNINVLLINSGNITSRLDLNKMERGADFYNAFFNNIRGNSQAKEKGLKEGFNYIA